MLKYADLYIQLRNTFPELNCEQGIVEAFMMGLIDMELSFELLSLYDEVVRG